MGERFAANVSPTAVPWQDQDMPSCEFHGSLAASTNRACPARVKLFPPLIYRASLHRRAYRSVLVQIGPLAESSVDEIDCQTIRLAGTAMPQKYQFIGSALFVWFASADVAHLLGNDFVELTVAGTLTDGRRFRGSDSVWVW